MNPFALLFIFVVIAVLTVRVVGVVDKSRHTCRCDCGMMEKCAAESERHRYLEQQYSFAAATERAIADRYKQQLDLCEVLREEKK